MEEEEEEEEEDEDDDDDVEDLSDPSTGHCRVESTHYGSDQHDNETSNHSLSHELGRE